MRPWHFPLELDPDSKDALFIQISRAIANDIQRGRLLPGAVLPGSRTLAKTLGVHRNTALAAYRELEAEGYLVSEAQGTLVSRELPARAKQGRQLSSQIGFDLAPAAAVRELEPGEGFHFGGGTPDTRLAPLPALARAFRRALVSRADNPLNYGDSRGHPALRKALVTLLSEARGIACDDEQLVVTHGSQMALDLVARAVVRPGDVVAVEDPGYPPAWSAFSVAGAQILPIPVDAKGIDVAALARLKKKQLPRAVYVTPQHQFPTTVTLVAARRMELLEWARKNRVLIIEDDYDFEFHYDASPTLPLASSDRAGVVAYVGTLSKVLAPGLRVGYVAGPRALVERLTFLRRYCDRQGDHPLEVALAELFDDGTIQRHARKMRRTYLARRDAAVRVLQRKLGDAVAFDVPSGGMSLWFRAQARIDVDAWAKRAAARGAAFYPGSSFDFKKRNLPAARLGFSLVDEREFAEAVRRMAEAL